MLSQRPSSLQTSTIRPFAASSTRRSGDPQITPRRRHNDRWGHRPLHPFVSQQSSRETDTPGEEERAEESGEDEITGYELLEEDDGSDDGNPPQVHHTEHQQQRHQGPATTDAKRSVVHAHESGTAATTSPTGQEEPQRRPALADADFLHLRELVDARADEQDSAERPAGGFAHRIDECRVV